MSARSSTLIEISENSEGFLFSETGYLKFTPDSKSIFAASQDGLIFKYDYESNKLKNMTECSSHALPFNEKIGMISVSNHGYLATASESHELVRLYKMGENGKFEEPKLVTKCVGSTDALALNPSGTILCCSGKDNVAKVISIKDDDFQVLGQIPLTHFVKSICFYEHEDCSYLALLQVDGLLKVFNIVQNNPAPQLFKVLSGPKSDMKGKFQLSCKDGVLGVLYGGKTLRFYNLLNDFSIISESDYNASILSFELVSKDAALISSVDEKISLFAMAKCQVIKSISYTNVKTSSIAAADETFACIFDSIKSELFQIEISINQNDLISAKIKREEKKGKLEKLKKKSKFLDDSASASDDEESEDIEDEEEELDEEDEGIVGFSEDEVEGEEEIDEDEKEDSEGSDDDSVSYTSAVRVKKHPVVQPCCTQFRNLSRYLAYNNIGFITCRQELDQMDLFKYDIEFMDRGSHQPIRFDERVSYDLAALGDKGAVFASTGVGAELKYKSFDNSDESWNFPLPLGTEPILLAVNSKSIYLVNKRGILNIYSLSGLLCASVRCPGRPVSLIASENGQLFMFTEDSEGVLCHRLDSKNGGVIKGSQSSRVILGSEEQLIWFGVSFSGVLGALSSGRKFSILLTRGTDRWTEILETSANEHEFWPVYFDVNTLSGVKTASRYPDPYPAPIVTDIPFKIPELPIDSVSQSYEEIIRTNWILNETSSTGLTDREKKKLFASADRHLLELAQISIKSNRLNRLCDLARWASNEKTVELLVQLAKHHKLVAIVEDLESIKKELFHQNVVIVEDIANTTFTMNYTLNSTSNSTNTTWSTPQLPEIVAKESPSGILANLTPIKTSASIVEDVNAVASSPAELAPSPSNPFAKENSQPIVVANEGNAMLDYISAMMKMNSSGKRKATDETSNNTNKKSSLGSNVVNSNTQ